MTEEPWAELAHPPTLVPIRAEAVKAPCSGGKTGKTGLAAKDHSPLVVGCSMALQQLRLLTASVETGSQVGCERSGPPALQGTPRGSGWKEPAAAGDRNPINPAKQQLSLPTTAVPKATPSHDPNTGSARCCVHGARFQGNGDEVTEVM